MRNKLLFMTAFLALAGTAALELSAHSAMTIAAPKRSPSTGENGNATLVDEASRHVQIMGVVLPDANGVTGLNSHYVAGKVSPVTGKEEPGRYKLADGTEIPLVALGTINQSTHTMAPLALPASVTPRVITALGNFATGGSVGTAALTVDISLVLNISQTTASQTLTLPSPTDATHAKVLYAYNAGSASFTLLGASVAAGAAKGALWNGTAWIGL